MTRLADQRCEACTPGSKKVAPDEARKHLGELPGWKIVDEEGMPVLRARYKLADFAAALGLVQEVAVLAEEADHHPRIVLEWGRVEVAWWTHAIGGLHLNDFIMAARTSRAASAAGATTV